jgi:hypothetical protein
MFKIYINGKTYRVIVPANPDSNTPETTYTIIDVTI